MFVWNIIMYCVVCVPFVRTVCTDPDNCYYHAENNDYREENYIQVITCTYIILFSIMRRTIVLLINVWRAIRNVWAWRLRLPLQTGVFFSLWTERTGDWVASLRADCTFDRTGWTQPLVPHWDVRLYYPLCLPAVVYLNSDTVFHVVNARRVGLAERILLTHIWVSQKWIVY